MTYQIGPTAETLDDVRTSLGVDPSSIYSPGAELVHDHGGGVQVVGYPRSMWKFTVILITAYRDDLLDDMLAWNVGQYSGEVYVQTRDEFDNWAIYRALMRIPNPLTLDRWGEHYRDVKFDFVLLEDVTP